MEGNGLEAANLSQVLRAWSDDFFANHSIDVIWDLQRLDTSLAFQSHLQGEFKLGDYMTGTCAFGSHPRAHAVIACLKNMLVSDFTAAKKKS